jgi:hypothetical protein
VELAAGSCRCLSVRRYALVLIGCGLVGISVGGCDGAGRERHAWCGSTDRACVAISRQDLGPDWPFSLREGALSCKRDGAITFAVRRDAVGIDATGDEVFGLNRAAHELGYAPPYPIWQWGDGSRAPDLRKSLKIVLERGRELCG